MPKADEIAVLTVNGTDYKAWDSVWVHQEWADVFTNFRFSATEALDPADNSPAKSFAALQIKPGDKVTVTLAGQLAVTGRVFQRQAFADAFRHGVLIAGQSLASDAINSEIVKKGGQFRGYNIKQIAEAVTENLEDVHVTIKGNTSNLLKPFKEDVQYAVGESPYNFIDRLARMRGGYLTDDETGAWVIHGGIEGGGGGGGELAEGVNIQSERVTIDNQAFRDPQYAIGQVNGNDERPPRRNSEVNTQVPGNNLGRKRPGLLMVERPETQEEIKQRAEYEVRARDSESVLGEIVVKGWLRDGGGLWKAGDHVSVHAPMMLVEGDMGIKSVTFTQDNQSGTLTTIEIANPKAMGGPDYKIGPGAGS